MAPHPEHRNPVLPGFFPDPSIVRVGEDYYLINSTFQYFPAIVISQSRDLVNWKQIGHVFTKNEELDLREYFDGCGIWAPDISWHDGEFFIFYCLVQLKMDRSVNVRGNYMVKSKSIHGPWSEPVQLTDHGNDPSHFVDDDGTHYMLYAAGIPKGTATKIVRLNDECTEVIGEAQWIDYGIQVKAPEGPHLFKKDGWYYHTMAAGSGVYEGHHQLIARSRHIFGPYEPGPHNPFIAQFDESSMFYHHGHAKLVQTWDGDWWAAYLVRRHFGGFSPLGRETGIDRVDWLDDGWPVLNQGTGPSEGSGGAEPQALTFRDDFDAAHLDLRWNFVRNPEPSHFSLSECPGWLRISTAAADVDAPAPQSILVQRETGHHFTATTRMEFQSQKGGEAGLLAYYGTKCFIKFGLAGGGLLRLEECRGGERTILAELDDIADGPLDLRMEVEGLRRSFSFRQDGGAWKLAGLVEDASFLSDEGTPDWGFTGTMTGMFAAHHGSGLRVPAYFDFFSLGNTAKA
jgi:xylan 1,4-beta-xylosidase